MPKLQSLQPPSPSSRRRHRFVIFAIVIAVFSIFKALQPKPEPVPELHGPAYLDAARTVNPQPPSQSEADKNAHANLAK